ncbi:MAG: GntR family transcriptional regulator [Pirellulales bacterium]|nr:GntR family transcriptional regulator [Pirellulales bacterium]
MPATRSDTRLRRQKVVDAIQEEILNGRLKPGEPLRQIPLSKQHNVSQSVIRESLQTLEQHGLVTSSRQVGFAVRTLDVDELVDAYRVREVLEGLAARLCCRKASRDDVDTLQELARQIHDCSGESARSRRSELEYQFHQRFLTLSGNETLQRVSIGYRFVGNLVVTARDPEELLEEHLAIVEAVAKNQPEKAERLARLHVSLSAESILKQGV